MSPFPIIEGLVLDVRPVGSRVTCAPAPTGTDQDYLVLVREDKIGQFAGAVLDQGYELEGSDLGDAVESTSEFKSFRFGDVNLIATTNVEFFTRFMAATSVAKRLNLLDKADRIALFQAVLYGNGNPVETVPNG